MLVVVPLQDVWVTANFKETQLRKICARAGKLTCTGHLRENFSGSPRFHCRSDRRGAEFLLPPENATGNYVSSATHSGEDRARSDSAGESDFAAGDECGATIITQ